MPVYPDTVESGDLSAYDEGATGQFQAQQSTVKIGDWALEGTNSGTTSSIASTTGNGLNYPSPGDDIEFWVYQGSSRARNRFYFGYVQGSAGAAPSGKNVQVSSAGSTLTLKSGNTTDYSTSVSIPANAWYRVLLETTSGGTVTATLYDDTGSQMAQVSSGSGWWSSTDGIAWMVRDSSGTTTSYFDAGDVGLLQPSDLTATAVGFEQIDLSWTGVDEAIEYRISHSVDDQTYELLATVDSQETTYSHTGLSSGTTHYYYVTAYDGNEESPSSNTDSATTSQPEAVVAVDATGLTTVDLTITDQSTTETEFRLYRNTVLDDVATGTPIATIPTSSQGDTGVDYEYTDDTAETDTIYYYAATAADGSDESEPSPAVTAVTDRETETELSGEASATTVLPAPTIDEVSQA